ncbi:cobalamin B12-binding domain-containing protein [Eubacterium limosum]|uniref:cobalamin B12-binding domain-containing protein n=1 Tax=Eubacterium limosum TaxID=1736 RepID=UPI001062AB4B|nr:cobalamin-dependent protein [Eubacterium limosum]
MIQMIINAMVELDEDKLKRLIDRAIHLKTKRIDIMRAMDEALEAIGKRFECQEYTMSDLMMSGILYEEVLKMLDLYEPETNDQNEPVKRIGTILVGTIEDDVHDIGKIIFKNSAITANFRVIDLGVDVKPELFVLRTKEIQPDILAISAILTSTRDHIIKTIDLLKESNVRKKVKLIIGGGAIDKEMAQGLDIDGFAENAFKGVELCRQWMAQ